MTKWPDSELILDINITEDILPKLDVKIIVIIVNEINKYTLRIIIYDYLLGNVNILLTQYKYCLKSIHK